MRTGWLSLLLLAGCNGQPAIAPDGIVSNNPCIDAILAEIAAPGQIAAVSSYSHDADSGSAPLDWARSMPAVGTSAEEIIAARPRLLLTGNLASNGTNAALAKADLKFAAFGVPANIEESKAQIRAIAAVIGQVNAGEKLVARIDGSIKLLPFRGGVGMGRVRNHNVQLTGPTPNPVEPLGPVRGTGPSTPEGEGLKITAIIWQNGGFVPGAGTLQDDLLSLHGFANASQTYGLKSWDVLPLETLIRNPPQVIFMPQSAKGDDARALSARRQLFRHLKGNVRIVPFPDKLLFCGGPTMIEVSRIFAQTRETMQ